MMARKASRGRDRYGSRSRGREMPAWLAIVGIIVLLAGVATAGWLVVRQVSRDAIDELTLCPRDGASGSLAILLDLTDPLGATQSIALRAKLDRMIGASPRGTLVALGRVSDQPDQLGAAIAICRPMTGEEAGDIVRNSTQVEARYREAFTIPLQRELAAMLDATEASQSPIMEGLQALLGGVAAMPVEANAPRRIVIVSDLLQHSAAMSFYRGDDWASFRASPDFARLARNLDDAEVTIIRVPRPGARIADATAVDDFWVRYLDAQGAAAVMPPETLGDL